MSWILNLQKSISKLIFAGYKGSKNPVRNRLKIQFVELDFSKMIFRNQVQIKKFSALMRSGALFFPIFLQIVFHERE